ncbi:MAG: hypothetical protein HHJ13_00315 [Phycicoccus sp.]|nr:hypothetical protein [Phycicoccus sp.]
MQHTSAQQSFGAAALRRDDFDAHYDAIWAPHVDQWSDDAVLSVCWDADAQGDRRPAHLAEHHPVRDRDAIWAAIARRGGDRKVLISIAPRSLLLLNASLDAKNETRAAWARPQTLTAVSGGNREALAMPAVFADIDFHGGSHAAENLPTQAEADELLARLPMGPPSLLIMTGGGYHCWWAFSTLPSRTEEDDARARLKAWLKVAFDAHDWKVDDTSRGQCTRAAGTLIGKGGDLRAITLLAPSVALQAVAA